MPESKKADTKFIDYHVKLRSLMSEKQMQVFKSLKNNRDIVLFIVNLEQRPRFQVKVELNRGKILEEAKILKGSGNQYFHKEDYGAAFSFYSQAILKSSRNIPGFSEELPVFYANRSAALYHLKKFNLSIRDVDFALKIGYPRKLKYKVLDRKARCLLALEKHQLACEVFQQTVSALDDAKLSSEKRQKWQKDIQIMLLMMSKNKRKGKSSSNIKPNQGSTMIGKRNATYNAITSAINIKSTKELGRFGEAKTDIKAGEIILIEDAHCAVLLQEYLNTNCYVCFKRVECLEPCPTCDQVIFCSHECKDSAISSFHGVECSILSFLWGSAISVTCMMALRIVTQQKLEHFVDKKQSIIDVKTKQLTKLNTSQYESVQNLVTHEERRKEEDLLNRGHMAVFLLECLKKTSYFENATQSMYHNTPFTENEIYIAELLLQHLQILQFNAHEVSEVQVPDGNIEASRSEFIGGALYPTLALFNHSCNPSVTRYFEGTRVIAVTVQKIKAGEMVGENYGPIFTDMRRDERQRILSEQYWFECTCEACVQDWPTLLDMNQLEDIRLRCSNKKCGAAININPNADHFLIKCPSCSQNVNMFKPLKTLQESDAQFAVAKNFMKISKTKKALEEFLKILNLLDEHLVPPYKDYYLCQQAIRTCFLLVGNLYKSDSKMK